MGNEPNSAAAGGRCHVCGADELRELSPYESLHRVTSDCKPWPAGGRLAVCPHCSCAEAVIDAKWQGEAGQIYEQYTIYHQSQGAEQSVFDQASGQAMSRSSRLVQRLQRELPLPSTGRALDIGCGNGAFLRAFVQATAGWKLAGMEVNDRYKEDVEKIPGVERLYTCPAGEVPGQFHLITLIHALEHIPGPKEYVASLWEKLEPGGLLLVQVPDCQQNPFMFMVADHSLHCFLAPLRELVESAGYAIERAANDWVAKEITIVARKTAETNQPRALHPVLDTLALVKARLVWLTDLAGRARRVVSEHGKVGIFGTSIAATWLFAELNGNVSYFVDEDPNRIGRSHMGRPILGVKEVPGESHLIVPLPPFLARAVSARVALGADQLHLPGEIP